MPQASDELRERWGGECGVGEDKAMSFLEERGFKLTRGWEWIKPSPDYVVLPMEWDAMSFLVFEWDFGGLATDPRNGKDSPSASHAT